MSNKDKFDLVYSTPISISGIDEVVTDLQLSEATNLNSTISGVVTDSETGNVISDATVKIFNEKGNPLRHTKTDKNGGYSFNNLNSGTYSVAGSHALYNFNIPQQFTISNSQTSIINLQLTANPELKLGNIAGIVFGTTDEEKKPLQGVKLTLFLQADGQLTQKSETISISDGEFVFYNLADGDYSILATHDGHQATTTLVTVKSGLTVNITINLLIDIATASGTINGTIKNNQGLQVENAFVGLYSIDDDKKSESLIAHTRTNAIGQYFFGNVAAGKYIVKSKQTETKETNE